VTLLDGRTWEGAIVREDKDTLVLRTVGGDIEVSTQAIRNIDRGPTRREQYLARLAEIDKEDADQHFLLALWCRRAGLKREADYHLQYACGLEPDHDGARRVLGQVKYEGTWMSEREAKEAQGLRWYDGRWMTKEAAQAAEAEALRREMKAELERQVRALGDVIANPRSEKAQRSAIDQLMSLRDPLAYDAIVGLCRYRDPQVRIAALRAVDKLQIPGADDEVLRHALYDEDGYVRDRARKSMEKRWNESMLPETLKALRSTENPPVRFAAALLLGVVKPVQAVAPLIEAIYVQYRVKRSADAGAPAVGLGGYVTRPNPTGGDGRGPVIYDPVAGVVGAGPGSAWKPVDAPDDDRYAYLINYAALDALRAITQKDFGVNKRAWRDWWDENKDEFQVWKEIK
jgi:hypothetical protein